MKKKNKKQKTNNVGRNVALVFLILFIIMLGLLSVIFFKNLGKETTGIENDDNDVTKLTLMGEQLYSEYYYKIISEGKTEEEIVEYLKKYETIGLKIDLVELEKYNDEYEKYVANFVKENKDCKKEETMVIIYPQSPYTNKDFKSELSVVCKLKKTK